jgi:hypothetical protein
VRVWLDNGLIMDYWQQQDYQWNYVDGTYLEGLHTIKVEYFEKSGGARIRFWWELSSTNPTPGGPAPTPVPGPTPIPAGLGPWQGEYFNNRNLTGTARLVRQDANLDFDWGWNAPAPQINQDGFSVRWTGNFNLAAGRYTFTTFSDDGVRVYVDGKRLIDSWQSMRGTRSGTVDLSAGTHSLLVEYFERSGRANMRLSVKQVGGVTPPNVLPPVSPPVACEGGPLRLDAWPVAQTCTVGGWVATIFVQGHGGDCRYTYSWENQVKGGPASNAMTFQVSSAGWNTAIVGGASVSSAGQTTEVELYVPHPKCP